MFILVDHSIFLELFGQQQWESQYDSLQTYFSTLWMEPFGGRVNFSATAPRPDGYSWKTHGKRDVSVGGGTIEMRLNAEFIINCPNDIDDVILTW